MNMNNRIGRWSLILGIMIVLNLFFNYAISVVHKAPQYNDFCPLEQVVTVPDNQNECVSQGGQWTDGYKPLNPELRPSQGYCDLQFTCRQNFEEAQKTYSRNVFIVLVVLGAISVLVGNMFAQNEVISSGLSLAGVLSFLVASARYWGAANDVIRLVILAIALGLLFWVAMKKFKNG